MFLNTTLTDEEGDELKAKGKGKETKEQEAKRV